MNYALENNKHFFMFYDHNVDGLQILDISATGKRFESYGEYRCNSSLLHDSLKDCIESLNGYRKPVLYHGENVNVWQPDLFIKYNKFTGEFYREYHFDDSILKKYCSQDVI